MARNCLKKYMKANNLGDHKIVSNIDQDPRITNLYPHKVYCGSYEKDSIIKAKILKVESIGRFFFHSKHLSNEQEEFIRCAPKFCRKVRPYVIKIGDTKIYADPSGHRCKILDLYPVLHHGQIKVQAVILLIDEAQFLYNVDLQKIHELPPALDGIEPETKLARLDLYPSTVENIDDCFRRLMGKADNYRLKINNFSDGLYYVDVVDTKRSIVNFLSTIDGLEAKSRKIAEKKFERPNGKFNRKVCLGTSDFLRTKFIQSTYDLNISKLSTILSPIKIVWWEDPQCVYIIPADPEFINVHQSYKIFMEYYRKCLAEVKDEDAAVQTYKMGDLCFFRDYINRDVGPWLRGVVLEAPKISNFDCSLLNEEYCCGPEELSGIFDIKNFVYRIQSVDYGFKVYKSALNMRPVLSPSLFRSYDSWALRCNLVGVFPNPADIDSNNPYGFSTTCIHMMESWIRRRLLDTGNLSSFFMLPRSKLSNSDFLNDVTKITLFHRTTLPLISINQQKLYKFECLNADLISYGYVTDRNPDTGKSTDTLLEQHLVDLLVSQQKL